MNRDTLNQTKSWVKEQLETTIDFWLEKGLDPIHGGVYTCLDRKGDIYSTDKSVWMQGRCAWLFAHLCHVYGVREEWLSASKSCLDFMENYCINREAGNRMYFQVTKEGQPLRQRRYCFSEGFYAIANAEYYGVTGDKIYLERARKAYQLIYKLNHGLIEDPTGLKAKGIPTTRKGRTLADPMIFLNITSILKRVDKENSQVYQQHAEECAKTILTYHFKEDLKCTLENVGEDGAFWEDVTVGRIVNPGHTIECSWFLMDYAKSLGEEGKSIYEQALKMFDYAMEAGWDTTYGGLLYFTDCLGKPPESYEHDMKLWWPHNELLIAAMMAYCDTKDEKYLSWFNQTLAYCKKYFADEVYGEWYGYLRRDGEPTMPSTKGSTFKGPFHLPRCLVMLDQMLETLKDS